MPSLLDQRSEFLEAGRTDKAPVLLLRRAGAGRVRSGDRKESAVLALAMCEEWLVIWFRGGNFNQGHLVQRVALSLWL